MTSSTSLAGPGLRVPAERRYQREASLAGERTQATRRAYAAQWKKWTAWAEAGGVSALPASPEDLADYLFEQAGQGASMATIRQARTAVAAAHQDAGLPDPTASRDMRAVIAGLARDMARPQLQTPGLTRESLTAIQATAAIPRSGPERCETPPQARARGRVDVALISVMRDAMLRRSEAASLTWGDVSRGPDGSGRLSLKTDRSTALYLGTPTMRALDAVRPAHPSPEDEIFGLGGEQISRRIKAAAKAAGLPSEFTANSPRVGMAQDLAASGCEIPDLMAAGRWGSPDMAARYTRSLPADRGAVARYYAQGPR